MKNVKRYSILILSILILALAFFALKPIPNYPEHKCNRLNGIVEHIYTSNDNDIYFTIMGGNENFYINRGKKLGLDVEKMKKTLPGKEVVIYYPPYWTPLDPFNNSRHISKMVTKDSILFNEIAEN